MLLPVIDINICNTSNQKFQLSLVEYANQLWWDQILKAGQESVKLLRHSLLDSPFSDKSVLEISNSLI